MNGNVGQNRELFSPSVTASPCHLPRQREAVFDCQRLRFELPLIKKLCFLQSKSSGTAARKRPPLTRGLSAKLTGGEKTPQICTTFDPLSPLSKGGLIMTRTESCNVQKTFQWQAFSVSRPCYAGRASRKEEEVR